MWRGLCQPAAKGPSKSGMSGTHGRSGGHRRGQLPTAAVTMQLHTGSEHFGNVIIRGIAKRGCSYEAVVKRVNMG